ncbi:MAG: integration host factor subunit beta [Treponema sp.]|nr:integration host factor subunit beta [Treponema sp.]
MAVKKITKADVVSEIYDKTGMTRKEIVKVLDLFVHEVKTALVQRCVVELRGFGTFEVKIRKARPRARNPKTGETVSVRSHGVVSFRPGRDLKQDVWNIREDEANTDAGVPNAGSGDPSPSMV